MAITNPFSARPGDNLFATAANTPAPAKTQAATFNVNQGSTVAGQLNGLIAQNSPYIQAARAGAQRQANSRGLINSSMAAGAGETAAIQSALPIAQQDAQSNFEAQRFTLQGQNDFDTQYNQFQQQAYMQGRDAAFGNAAAENQFGRQMDLQTNQQAFQGGQAELDRGQQLNVIDKQQNFQGGQAALDRGQQLTLQGNEQGFAREQSGLDRNQQLTLQGNEQGFAREQSGLDRNQQLALQGNELGFSREQLAQQATQAGLDRNQQLTLQGNDLGFSREQLAQQAAQAGLDRAQQSSLVDRELASTENRQTQQLASQERIADKENQLRQTLLTTQIQSDRDIQTLRATLDKELAAFNAEIADERSLLDIGRGRTVSLQQYQLQLGNSFLQAAGEIWNNPEILDTGDKRALIEQLRSELNGLFSLAGTLQSTPLFNQ